MIAVIGEALIDLVPGAGPGQFVAHPGGSPFNVAVGCARLNQPTLLLARLSDTAFGRLLRSAAEAEGIDLTRAINADEPTTLAVVSLDSQARAAYDFYVDGTADWQWTTDELSGVAAADVVHFGSLASWLEPGGSVIRAALAGLRDQLLISYDPNVRPSLMGSVENGRGLVEAGVAVAHLVKASREDVEWLYPGAALDQVAAGWLALGGGVVVITDGPDGAYGYTATSQLHVSGRVIELVDTVGAGDAFTSGLLHGLLRRGINTPGLLRSASSAEVTGAMTDAVVVSALTCERVGADPPRLTDADFMA